MLQGIWLALAVVAAFVAGVFASSQTLKDFFKGVPGEVRGAIKAIEAKAMSIHQTHVEKAATEAVKAINPPMPTPPANPQA